MKFTRAELLEMIQEEVVRRIDEITEAGPKSPTVQSAEQDRPPPKSGSKPRGPKPADKAPGDPPEEADGTDPSDAAPDPAAVDPDGDAGDEPSGAVNDWASGKTVQSVSIEPQSKILPGAKEVTLTFNETTDPMKILVTATGQVKFFVDGQLHDIP